jgi:hydroxymethylglutaryl-CoA synthase
VFLPAVTEVAERLAADAGPITSWSLPDPDGRLGPAVAKRVGAAGPTSAFAAVGDAGAAAPLLGLAAALDRPGLHALVGSGGGRTTGITIEVERPLPGAADVARLLEAGRPASYTEVLRARGELVAAGETVEMAVPPGSAAFVRGEVEMLGLLGARCVDCGTISTPPSIHPTCTGCGGAKLEPVPLARAGAVQTFVVNHTMPAPFVAPLPLVVVDLDDGARIMLQGLADDADALAIGDRVALVLRRYTVERGVPVYGFKVQRSEGLTS